MQVVVGVLFEASVYVLLATGYVLVYRASRVLNLAHGDLMALGGYLLLTCASLLPRAPLVAMAVVVLAGIAIGAAVYRFVMRPVAGYPVFASVLMTVSLSITLQGLIILVWTAGLQRPLVALGLRSSPIALPGGAVASWPLLATIVAAAVVYVAVVVFVHCSRSGIEMRAVAERPRLAAHRGVRIHRVYTVSWGLATTIAVLAGVLYGSAVHLVPATAVIGFKAFPVAVIGGIDSLGGVVPAALFVAAAEQLTIRFVSPLLADVVPFAAMILLLVVRPWGLFGTREELDRI
jgi:branched-chain amino acid transport system permease protein